MQKTKTIQIGSRSFTLKELPVRQVWELLNNGSEAAMLLPTYTQVFMKALGGYVIKFFPLFLLGAIFGKLMEVSGSARSIAAWIVGTSPLPSG